jgi:hypothetical protein
MQDWFFQHEQHGLCVTFKFMIDCGVSENTLWRASLRGSKSWPIIDHPEHGKKKLIIWTKLKFEYQSLGLRLLNNIDPLEYIKFQPIKDLVQPDHTAREFFINYKFADHKCLPLEYQKKYCVATDWLNMLQKVAADPDFVKKTLKTSMDNFYSNVGKLIKSEGIELPSSYRHLKPLIKQYGTLAVPDRYKLLISEKFGNENSKKLKDEVAESLLLELIGHANQFDDVYICKKYNDWAISTDRKPITPGTVGNYRRKNGFDLEASRSGKSPWYNTYGKVIHRSRPSAPLLLIDSDDNDLDLFFQHEFLDKKGHRKINYFHRFKLVVVMDAFNDYILGYSYFDGASKDAIKLAYLDAIHHIHQLTGGFFFPHQIRTDHFGIGSKKGSPTDLQQFYESIAIHTPPALKNARSKSIEAAFGKVWHQQLKQFSNYAGHNITSQFRLNQDNLDLVKTDFPHRDEAYLQIEQFINSLRNLKGEDGRTRQEVWLEAFMSSEMSQEKRVSHMRVLQTLGEQHTHTNKITNAGLQVTLGQQLRTYDIPDDIYTHYIGKSVQVYYSPLDYSKVFVTDGDKLRFIASEFQRVPQALADFKEGDRARLNIQLELKRKHVEAISERKNQRQQILSNYGIQASSYLQANVLEKQVKFEAEKQYLNQQQSRSIGFNPIDKM